MSTAGFSLAHTFGASTGVVPRKQNREKLVSVVRTCFSFDVKWICFTLMFSTLLKIKILGTFNLSSANALNLMQSKKLSFGIELTSYCYDITSYTFPNNSF